MTGGPAFLHRRRLLSLLLALPAMALTTRPALAAPEPGRPRDRVVFHINRGEPDYQEVVLRNLDNHIRGAGAANVEIKVLLHGAGVALLLLPEALGRVRGMRHANATPAFRQRIDVLRAQGVQFLVSGRTLEQHAIDRQRDLYGVPADAVVDNALAHLTRLQQHGYTYIKP